MSGTDGVRADVQDGVLKLTIDRPGRRNAVGDTELRFLSDALTEVVHGSEIRAVLLGGAGGSFCSGIDLSEVAERGAPAALELVDVVSSLVDRILACPVPTVAAVSGPALGMGVSLALACDLTVAVDTAYFQLPFTTIGLMPDGGATGLVAASVGRQRAMHMAMVGERVSAATAYEWGMLAAIHSYEDFAPAVEALAEQLVAGATEAFALTADAVNAATLRDMTAVFAREAAGQHELSRQSRFQSVLRKFLSG